MLFTTHRILFYGMFAVGLLTAAATNAQHTDEGPIHWMTYQEAMAKQAREPKKVFIDMYTSWCSWCKKMDAGTFKDSTVAAYMNNTFYAVKLDAETRDTLTYKGKQYHYLPDSKCNELAILLLNGQMSYPTSVYLDEHQNVLSPVSGFMAADQIIVILHYFGDDMFKKMTWEEYVKSRK